MPTELPHVATYECRQGLVRLQVRFCSDGDQFTMTMRKTQPADPVTGERQFGPWREYGDRKLSDLGIFASPAEYAETVIHSSLFPFRQFGTIELVS
jgi:hypothetical protein